MQPAICLTLSHHGYNSDLQIFSRQRKIHLDVSQYDLIFLQHFKKRPIFTAPNGSCGKVMFSQASLSHSVQGGGGGYSPPGWVLTTLTPSGYMELGYCGIRLTNGQYASYWNAFLLAFQFLSLYIYLLFRRHTCTDVVTRENSIITGESNLFVFKGYQSFIFQASASSKLMLVMQAKGADREPAVPTFSLPSVDPWRMKAGSVTKID